MIEIDHIDYHLADSCNLACEYCSHYSNFTGPSNFTSLEQAEEEWTTWSKIIQPKRIHLIGGEPMLNPHLCDLVMLARSIWEKSTICIYSNGILIDRHPELKVVLDGGLFFLSLHHRNSIDEQIKNKIETYFKNSNVELHIIVSNNTEWYSFYQITDSGELKPYDNNDQRKSWKNCIAGQSRCYVLRNNMLWKCAQIAFSNRAGITWFNDYQPCKPNDDIAAWVKLEDEPCCSNCPSTRQLQKHGSEYMKRRLPVINL
jgi:organic radical activating enzyme